MLKIFLLIFAFSMLSVAFTPIASATQPSARDTIEFILDGNAGIQCGKNFLTEKNVRDCNITSDEDELVSEFTLINGDKPLKRRRVAQTDGGCIEQIDIYDDSKTQDNIVRTRRVTFDYSSAYSYNISDADGFFDISIYGATISVEIYDSNGNVISTDFTDDKIQETISIYGSPKDISIERWKSAVKFFRETYCPGRPF